MTSTQQLPPAAHLLELEEEARELLPDHTFKATTRLIKDWPIEKAIEWLEDGVERRKRALQAGAGA